MKASNDKPAKKRGETAAASGVEHSPKTESTARTSDTSKAAAPKTKAAGGSHKH
jgi:hypothetical protein